MYKTIIFIFLIYFIFKILNFATQVFQRIENVLVGRCSNSSRPPCHNIKKLFQEERLEGYEPYGKEGPKVDLLSSISLVNRCCDCLFIYLFIYFLKALWQYALFNLFFILAGHLQCKMAFTDSNFRMFFVQHNKSTTVGKVQLGNFYLKDYSYEFYPQSQTLEPPCMVQQTSPQKVPLYSFHLNGHT